MQKSKQEVTKVVSHVKMAANLLSLSTQLKGILYIFIRTYYGLHYVDIL